MARKPFALGIARQTRFQLVLLLLAGVLAIFSAGEGILAQVPNAPAYGSVSVIPLAPAGGRDVGDWVRDGRRLEGEHRWGEALTHYEEALRQFPGEGDLKQRFDTARLHYEFGRRYNDRSYRDGLARMSVKETLDLYNEILLKLQAHYVESPRWNELVAAGARGLDVALGESAFAQAAGLRTAGQELERFRQELQTTIGQRSIRSRSDACDTVAAAARLAHDRLGTEPGAVVMEFACGAANSLDAYSAYLTADQLTEVYSQIDGHFVGLGVELKAIDGQLAIVRVIPNSPAKRAGLREGERIVAVGGRSTRELCTDRAANLLQGREGTTVTITVAAPAEPGRTGQEGSPADKTREVTLTRQRVDVSSVEEAHILDPAQGIAYLRLVCFQKGTARDLETALWNLHRMGMKALVVDLRGNPGGLLIAAVDAANLFLERGAIVTTRGRNAEEDFTYTARESGTWRVPLAVLIDQESASAAEIFAGAIRDHNRGTIVGTRSYGKGSIQGIFPLGIASAGIRLTTAKFYAPSGYPYSGIGVEPHVIVRRTARPIGAGTLDGPVRFASSSADPVVAAGLQVLQQNVAGASRQ